MRTLRSFKYAMNGLKTVWREEENFRIEIIAAVVILAVAYYLRFSALELLMIIVAVVLVLSAEIVNTAIEDLCNKVEPNHDPMIGKVKDTMAAFVFTMSLFSLVLGALAFYSHFG